MKMNRHESALPELWLRSVYRIRGDSLVLLEGYLFFSHGKCFLRTEPEEKFVTGNALEFV